MHAVLKTVDYERGTVLGAMIAAAMLVWLYGCQSRTYSLDADKAAAGQKVTRVELAQEIVLKEKDLAMKKAAYEAEAVAAVKMAENAVADLDRQDEMKRQLLATLSAVGTDALNGTLPTNPAGIATTVLGLVGTLVGGGALLDNRRKNRKIEEMKKPEGQKAAV